MENNTPKERKEWNPNPDQLELIRTKYAVFNNPPHTYTKTRLCEMFKITSVLFDRLVARHKIKPKKEPKGHVRDFSNYIRVPVPCNFGCPTFIVIHPDRDPIEAKKRYIKKHNFNKIKKQDGNDYKD